VSTKTFFVCPLCGRDFKGEVPDLMKRVGTFLRDVWFGSEGRGRGVIKLLHVYHAKDLARGSGNWISEVRGAVLVLARLLGFELTRETVREVTREFTVERGRRRIRQVETQAKAWARKRCNAGKRAAPARKGRGGTVAPLVMESWNPNESVGEGGTVAEVVQEEW
jgi:hypothetical protein